MGNRKPAWFRKTESILFDNKTYDLAIKNLERELDDIMPQASRSLVKMGQGSTKTLFEDSQTERWALKRAESPRARWLCGRILEKRRYRDGVREAKQHLSDEQNLFIQLYYDSVPRMFDYEIRQKMEGAGYPLSKNGFYRFRNGLVTFVAKYLGFI